MEEENRYTFSIIYDIRVVAKIKVHC